MANIPPRIDRDDRSPENLYVDRLEKDKKREEEAQKTVQGDPSKALIVDAFLIYLKKALSVFSPEEQKKMETFDHTLFMQEMAALRALFQVLANSDESHNPPYILQLTEIWIRLKGDTEVAMREKGAWRDKLAQFMDEIEKYPPGEAYSLGYYLIHHAGDEWLPFPFMNTLQALHLDNPTKGQLTRWIDQLSDIISLLET